MVLLKSFLSGRKTPILPNDLTKVDAFIKTWSIEDFSKKHGKMQICKAPDKNNRESYLKCRFVDTKNTILNVEVSQLLQNITSEEITKNKDKIRIGQTPSGNYILFDNRWKPWETINLK